jgi:hypothetical protein
LEALAHRRPWKVGALQALHAEIVKIASAGNVDYTDVDPVSMEQQL